MSGLQLLLFSLGAERLAACQRNILVEAGESSKELHEQELAGGKD